MIVINEHHVELDSKILTCQNVIQGPARGQGSGEWGRLEGWAKAVTVFRGQIFLPTSKLPTYSSYSFFYVKWTNTK